MDESPENIGGQIARAARASEKRQTAHGREWAAVFMIEDTVVIALHGSLTDAEKTLVRRPAGTAQVREFHRQLFEGVTDNLAQQIKGITGMNVRDKTAEIDLGTGGVAQIFTTDTMLADFLRLLAEPAGGPSQGCPIGAKAPQAADLKAWPPGRVTTHKGVKSVATASRPERTGQKAQRAGQRAALGPLGSVAKG